MMDIRFILDKPICSCHLSSYRINMNSTIAEQLFEIVCIKCGCRLNIPQADVKASIDFSKNYPTEDIVGQQLYKIE